MTEIGSTGNNNNKKISTLVITYFSVPHVYSRAELASIHNDILDGKKEARKLIVVDNKVYDITDFTLDHPGGEQVILTQEGRDASGKKKNKKKNEFTPVCV
jgi:cytochrome b involved in lipid metabolism